MTKVYSNEQFYIKKNYIGSKYGDPILSKLVPSNEGMVRKGKLEKIDMFCEEDYVVLWGIKHNISELKSILLGYMLHFNIVVHLDGHNKKAYPWNRVFLTYKNRKMLDGILEGDMEVIKDDKNWYKKEEGCRGRAYIDISLIIKYTCFGDYLKKLQKERPDIFSDPSNPCVLYEKTNLIKLGLKSDYISFVLLNQKDLDKESFFISASGLPLEENYRKKFLEYLCLEEEYERQKKLLTKVNSYSQSVPEKIKKYSVEAHCYRPVCPFNHPTHDKEDEWKYEYECLRKFQEFLPLNILHRKQCLEKQSLTYKKMDEKREKGDFLVEHNHFIPQCICLKYGVNPHHVDNLNIIPKYYHKELTAMQNSLINSKTDAEVLHCLFSKMIYDGLFSLFGVMDKLKEIASYHGDNNNKKIVRLIEEVYNKLEEVYNKFEE